jgi:NADPH:quinone reductase-like Zn-dependent oxidoreductase
VVIDPVGGEVFANSLNVLAPGGRIVTFGASGGPVPEPVPRLSDGRVVRRFSITDLLMADPHAIEQLDEIFARVQAGRMQVVVDRVYPLAEAAQAQRYVADRQNFGKVVLTVSGPHDRE